MNRQALLGLASAFAIGGVAQGATLFSDDFESYSPADPAVMSNWVHNGNGAGSNASRIFDTGNFGGSRLWIASAANANAGSGIDSTATITLAAGINHTFSANLVTETNDPNRTATGTYDLLIGGVSLIGGPQAFSARGDDAVGGEDSYADQITTHVFNSGAGGNLEIRIAFDSADGSNPFVGIDNVSITDVPEPGSLALLGLGGLALLRRRRA